MKIALTGANSSVGCNLLQQLSTRSDITAVAGVRSESARAKLPQGDNIQPCLVNFAEPASLDKAFNGCDCILHLAGILIESKTSKYQAANVDATTAVVAAAKKAGVKRLIFISVVGADSNSGNSYFKSKGDAEKAIMNSGLQAVVLRTPILLGPGTAGAGAIVGMASQPKVKILGGGDYTMRPLDVDDLCAALLKIAAADSVTNAIHELVGPTPIKYRDLISQAAQTMGKSVEVGAVPILPAKIMAGIVSTFKGGGMSPTVIDVITMDEVVNENADQALGLQLTSLEDTINKFTKINAV